MRVYLPAGDANAGLLGGVQLRRPAAGGGWATARQVAYAYYGGTTPFGNRGDLRTATVEDGSGAAVDTTYYRYYTPGQAGGYAHGLRYIFDPASYARLAAAVGDPLTAPDSAVAPYAYQYFEYDGQRRVTVHGVQGAGGAATGGVGTFTYSYAESGNAAGANSWQFKTVVTRPDGNQHVVYGNALGEVMLNVFLDRADAGNPALSGQQTATFSEYDGAGRVILQAGPSAVTGYDEGSPDLLVNRGGNYLYLADTSGLVERTSYYAATTATESTPGGAAGYRWQTSVGQGELGTPVPQETLRYYAHTGGGSTVYPVAADTVYRNGDGTGAQTTTYAYTWFADSWQPQSVTKTAAVVTAAENGPGTADVTSTVYDSYGQPVWTRDADGYLTYTAYDLQTGAVLVRITDVNTALTGEFSGLPAGWSTPAGGGLNRVTRYRVDALGRPVQETDPDGNVTYTVYDDVAHAARVYAGWNAATGMPTGPTAVFRDDRADGYVERLTMSATPHLTGGVPDGTEPVSNLQSLTRTLVNAAGQVVERDDYFDLGGLTYSAAPCLGAANTNYYATRYGNQGIEVDANGTIRIQVYDGQGRLASLWVGTNDTPASGAWSPGNNTGSANMVEVSSYQYDNGGVGDGNLTQRTDYPGGGAAARVTGYYYDWRDRRVATQAGVGAASGTHAPVTFVSYDNLGEVTQTRTYDGDGVSITTTGGVPQAPSAALLRSQVSYSYDEQGRLYRTAVSSVDPTSGSVSANALTTNAYYDHRGNRVAVSKPGGLWTKGVYDGAGRETVAYTTDGAGGTSWAAAAGVAGDDVLGQVETSYDASGNATLVTTRQRFDGATGTGPLGSPTSGVGARVYYTAAYYDAADRPTASVNVGTNGGVAWTRPATVPAGSDAVLVTGYGYDAAGLLATVTDPMGIVGKTYYDALGRKTKTVAAYTGGPPGSSSDVTTEYTYDGDNHVLTVQADQPGGTASQVTRFVYGVTTAGGSGVTSNDLLAAVQYPDPTTGAPSSSQQETRTVNALGQVLTATDRNGNVHAYTYDALGRQVADAVTTLGAGVDGSVRRIETAYDGQGHAYLVTSYDAASGGNVVNQVLRRYNGLGQLTAEYQQDGGAVNTSASPVVRYAYAEMAGGANNSRLMSMTYASGYQVNYNYSTGLNDTISRLSSLSDSTGTLEGYKYLGLGTVVERDHPQIGVNLTYLSQTGGTGDAGDAYTGLDRFGRVVDQLWQNTNTGTATDETRYGYNADGDVLYKQNLIDAALSQLFGYDNLHQLTGFQVGTLNATRTGLTGSASASQSWGLDALGNWTGVTTNGTTQTRTANAQNEYTAVGGATPSYDANGNLTTDETGKHFVYDAWNRLVAVKDGGGTTVAAYKYDGLGRRASVTEGGTTTGLIYSASWQVLEERVGGAATARYVWSPVYVDAMVLRDAATTTPGTLDQRLWVQQDANWNVTALVDGTGAVAERYAYSPYGAFTVLAADGSARGASLYGWVYLHQGGRYDAASGLYEFRARDFSPTLGRWATMDPLGFGGGDTNVYRFVRNAPTNETDPSGLDPFWLWNHPWDIPGDAWSIIFPPRSPDYIASPIRPQFNPDETNQRSLMAGDVIDADTKDWANGGSQGLQSALGEAAVNSAAVMFPAWNKITVDWEHIVPRHLPGGALTQGRTVFHGMTQRGCESLLREAWKNKNKVRVQGDRILFQSTVGRDTVEFWFNKATKTIVTAYPLVK